MSFAGCGQYKKNLDTLFDSEAFNKADIVTRWKMGYALLNSKYGLGIMGQSVAKLKGKVDTEGGD